MRTGLLAATILACLAPGCRCFSLPALAHRKAGALRAPARGLRKPPRPALQASADADAGLSKEQKLKKYQNLAVELITKANKLPPGASKTRYLQQARNAKAMADALSYTSEPLKPKQAAMDAAMAYKAAKEAKAPEAATAPAAISSPQAVTPGRPKKERIKFDIVSAEPEMTEELTKVVNWAYRGKEGQQGWTGEMQFIDGVRISAEDMRKTLQGNDAVVLVAQHKERLAGCIKVEQLDNGDAEVGMFAVDPDLQSCGLGSALLDAAHHFAEEVLGAKETCMMVLDNRLDILAWYQARGYVVTDEKAAFPEGLNCGKPKQTLQFVKLRRKVPQE